MQSHYEHDRWHQEGRADDDPGRSKCSKHRIAQVSEVGVLTNQQVRPKPGWAEQQGGDPYSGAQIELIDRYLASAPARKRVQRRNQESIGKDAHMQLQLHPVLPPAQQQPQTHSQCVPCRRLPVRFVEKVSMVLRSCNCLDELSEWSDFHFSIVNWDAHHHVRWTQ